MFILIIVKDINSKKHNVNKYIKIKIYLSNKNDVITLIKRKLHIVDNLTIKTLIEINIIKFKNIILDLEYNIIKIDVYQNYEIFIIITTQKSRINIIIYNKKRIIIFSHLNVVVLMFKFNKTRLMLLKNRDLLFKF